MPSKCLDVTSPTTYWDFCPNTVADYVFCVLFGLAFIVHLAQAIYHRKAYCWVVTMGAGWQTAAYVVRALSIINPVMTDLYVVWFVLILIAPLWTNAFVYMAMGRMVYNFTSTAKVLGVTAWRFGLYFVLLDIVAFIVQVYGAANAAGQESQSTALKALHIYMGGVGIQQFFIIVFACFAFQFHRMILKDSIHVTKDSKALKLLYALYVVLVLITVRIIFRLIEYSQGLSSSIPNHEVFQYCFDSLPMLFAFVVLSIVHPGRIMSGRECDIPSRKERKKNGIRSKLDIEARPPMSTNEAVF